MSSIQTALLSQPLPLSETSASNPFKPKGNTQAPEKVAKDFESLFTSMILKEMRKTLEPGSMFGEDSSDVYGGMFDQFLGQHIADSRGIGLAKMIREALERVTTSSQEASVAPKNLSVASNVVN